MGSSRYPRRLQPATRQTKVLLETPRGFVVFRLLKPDLLNMDNAVEHLWTSFVSADYASSLVCKRIDYQMVDDKSPLFIDKRLADMLKIRCRQTDLLAVGTPQHASMIKSQLGIKCIHDDVVMELMWGLNHLLKYFVPEENVGEEHLLHMSKGLDIVLRRHGFHNVHPHMVTEDVVNSANILYESDKLTETYSMHDRYPASLLREISGIDCRGWEPLKSATAFKMIWFPRERKSLLAQSHMMFTHDDISRLQAAQLGQYEGMVIERDILSHYRFALEISEPLTRAHKVLEVSLGTLNEKPPSHK